MVEGGELFTYFTEGQAKSTTAYAGNRIMKTTAAVRSDR